MSRTISEEKLLKKLDIPDFRHMTKDKMLVFASSVQKMDKEVAKAIISQFPNFKELASDSMKDGLLIIKELINSDNEEQIKLYDRLSSEQEIYFEILKKNDLTFDQQLIVFDKLESIRKTIIELNRDSKMFKLKMGTITVLGIGTVLLTAATLLGGNFETNDEEIE